MEIQLEKSIDAQVCGYIGRGVLSVWIDESGHLRFIMSDGSELDLGPVTVGEGDLVTLDPTLTRPDMAAEAKAAGAAIAQVSDRAREALQEALQAADTADAAKLSAQQAQHDAQNAELTAYSAAQEAEAAMNTADMVAERAGDLSRLETDHRDDLVGAINELRKNLLSDTGGAGGQGAVSQSERWVWSEEVSMDRIPLTSFPAATDGVRLRVYCLGPDGETVTFEIQPPEGYGFGNGLSYGFTYRGVEVIFTDDGEDLLLATDMDLVIYGFYYRKLTPVYDEQREIWKDEALAQGSILSGSNLSRCVSTGLTLGHLRAYRKWRFRLKNAGKYMITDFYIRVGAVTDPSKGTSLLRCSATGINIYYEWWDSARTKLAARSVYAGDSGSIDNVGTPSSTASATNWLYHNTVAPGVTNTLAALDGYDDSTPIWFYCGTAPASDFTWEFRGVTQ